MATKMIASQKKALRASMLKRIRALPEAHVASQSQQITNRILSSPFYEASKAVSCYLSMPGEVDTSPIVLSALRSGKRLFVPKVESGKMYMVQIYGEEDFRTLRSGVWGIKEPAWEWEAKKREMASNQEGSNLDLVIMPGVAFDRSFSRLGYGKGYYDQFLSSYSSLATPQSPAKPLLVAMALKEQLLETGQVPIEEHDWKVDLIVGADEVIEPVTTET